MLSSAEAARRISRAPAPVLFLDTCALLDLMRDPTRETFSSNQVEAAKRLLTLATARPRHLWLPLVAQIFYERSDNQTNVREEAKAKILRFEERLSEVQKLFAAHGLNTNAISPTLTKLDFPSIASSFVDNYFSEGFAIRRMRDIDRRANARMAANLAPSKRGQQTKDCIVIESYLYLAKLLREEHFDGSIVFLTSNKNDYSKPTDNGTIHPDLSTEFAAVRMTYAPSFQMAEYLLGSVARKAD